MRRRGDLRVASPAATEPAEALALIHFDGAAALRHVNGNLALLTRLLGDFVAEHGDEAARIQAAIADKDWPVARRRAHNLKGVALTLGASAVARAAAELESLTPPTSVDVAGDRIATATASLAVAIAEAAAEVAASTTATLPPIASRAPSRQRDRRSTFSSRSSTPYRPSSPKATLQPRRRRRSFPSC